MHVPHLNVPWKILFISCTSNHHLRAFNFVIMLSKERVNENVHKGPSSDSVDVISGELISYDEIALQALEKRVLRKTDMVILPMVKIPV
jgi:hypothetical protein